MEFNIRPLSRVCASSGAALQPGQKCWSVLVELDGKLVRQDIGLDAWEGVPENAVGHWQCQIPEDNGSQKKLDTTALFEYFVQLCESPNEAELDYQYVLALLLLRKKYLILEQSVTDEDETTMHLIGKGGEGPFEVRERELSDDQIQSLQLQLFAGAEAAA